MLSPRRWSMLTALALCAVSLTSVHASAQTDCAVVSCAPKRSLLVVGDSLTVGADSFGDLGDKLIAKSLWSRVRVDAAVGRKIPRGVAIVKEQMLRNPFTGGFIVALGTNDLLSSYSIAWHIGNVELLLKAAKGKPVLWVNVTYAAWRRAWVAKAKLFSAELAKLTAKYPNLTVANWASHFSTTSPYWSRNDGIHVSPSAYRDRARFISALSSTWWKKVTTPPTTTTTVPPSTNPPADTVAP